MSVWTTKALARTRKYIVLKHPLKGLNATVLGIKFRAGFAVVEKDSKSYNTLKKIPILKKSEELPLTFLKKLPFITRNVDVKIIFGQDVYKYFCEELAQVDSAEYVEKLENAQIEHSLNGGCLYKVASTGLFCSFQALPLSPSQYCNLHLFEDPKLEEMGIKIPKFIAKDEKDKLKLKVLKQLEKARVSYGKNNGESEET